MSTETTSLAEALPKEIQRCQEVLGWYKEIGPAGAFGHAMITASIAAAHKAMMEGDVVAMIKAYNDLKEVKS